MAANRSFGAGMSALLCVGYFFGILRANFLDGYSHFIFDVSVLGLYMVCFTKSILVRHEVTSKYAKNWMTLLIGWPLILALIPVHHYLVQLVGLRHLVLALPLLVLGARTRIRDLETIAMTLAVLNLIAFGFALAQYFYGIEPFFPRNSMTEIMYRSGDIKVGAERFHRIPATFSNAHTYGGTALMSLPLIINLMADTTQANSRRIFFTLSCIVTILGIFIAGPRVPVVTLAGTVAIMLLLPGLKPSMKSIFIASACCIGAICAYFIIADPRLQRFTSLSDTNMVESRVTGSLDFSLMDCFWKYPLGAGIGGVAGASLPFFLRELAPLEYVGAENEYIRIAAEQGIVGFLIWLAFLLTLAIRKPIPISKRWLLGTHTIRCLMIFSWATAFIGVGMLQGIPSSFLMVFMMGLLLRQPYAATASAKTRLDKTKSALSPAPNVAHVLPMDS